MVVSDKESVNIGKLRSGWKKPFLIESDSIEVVFTLTPDKDVWYATDRIPADNVILTDSTMTYEVISIEEQEISEENLQDKE